MFQRLVVSEWVDRCANRIGVHLPDIDPTEATRRAVALVHEAYEYLPEEAADTCALELPSLSSKEISDYETAPRSSWVLAFKLDGVTDGERQRGLHAAQAVLDAHSVAPFEAVYSQFKLECWDDSGFPDDMRLTADESRAHTALTEAWNAAHDSVDPNWPIERERGDVVARWPSKVRFEAARARLLAGQINVN